MVSFVEQRENCSLRNRVNDRDRDMSTEEKARIFSCLIGPPASAEKDMFVAYVGSLTNDRYVDDWILKLVLPETDLSKYRLPQESLRQKLSNFRKSLHAQRRVVVRWGFSEAGFGLLS